MPEHRGRAVDVLLAGDVDVVTQAEQVLLAQAMERVAQGQFQSLRTRCSCSKSSRQSASQNRSPAHKPLCVDICHFLATQPERAKQLRASLFWRVKAGLLRPPKMVTFSLDQARSAVDATM